MTRRKIRTITRQELEARLERAEGRRNMARDHGDIARVAQLEAQIEELTTAIRDLDAN